MDKNISHALNIAVYTYMESQWVNHGRDIGFYKARAHVLGQGCIYFYEPNSTIVVNIHIKGNEGMPKRLTPNPVLASVEGTFPDLVIEGAFRMSIVGRDDYVLLVSEVSND